MEVILMERIEKLGKMGDIVRVRPGYARNFLLPQKKAVRATEDNRSRFEKNREQLENVNTARREEAEAMVQQSEGLTIELIRQAGEAGQLYGSVSTRDIADAVTQAGVPATRQLVRLLAPIKAVGLYEVQIAIHPEVLLTVRVNVARSHDEAELQLSAGVIGPASEREPGQLTAQDVEADLEAPELETAEFELGTESEPEELGVADAETAAEDAEAEVNPTNETSA